MKRIVVSITTVILVVASHLMAIAVDVPPPRGYVNDYGNVITPDWEEKIEAVISSLKKETGAEVGILTIDSTGGIPVADYAFSVFEKWGVGEKEKDNGVLIVVAVKDRRLFIATGYGVESVITDGTAGEIRDRFLVPFFREGKFGEGLFYATGEIARLISGGKISVPVPDEARKLTPGRKPSARTSGTRALILLVIFIIVFFSAISLFRGPFIFFGGPFIGGGGGGFGGGGFGGFGGGSFGGGGAGGGW